MEFSHTLLISRVAPDRWHTLEDDLVVGRGEASRRPDGRLFVSIDARHGSSFRAFQRTAEAHTHRLDGAGLGPYISHALAEMIGCRIRLASRPVTAPRSRSP